MRCCWSHGIFGPSRACKQRIEWSMPNQSQVTLSSPRCNHKSPEIRTAAVKETPALRMPPIRHLRKMLDELEIKLDARRCLEHNNRHRYARRIPVERDLQKILQSLQDLIDSYQVRSTKPVATSAGGLCADSEVEDPGTQSAVRIQLKLSDALVGVLQTLGNEHVKVSDLVESVLWSSPCVQDTARLAGIRCPLRAPAA